MRVWCQLLDNTDTEHDCGGRTTNSHTCNIINRKWRKKNKKKQININKKKVEISIEMWTQIYIYTKEKQRNCVREKERWRENKHQQKETNSRFRDRYSIKSRGGVAYPFRTKSVCDRWPVVFWF